MNDQPCKHDDTTPSYEYVTCNNCGAVRTDSKWGIASNTWFRNLNEAKFYQQHGRSPEPLPANNA